MPGMTPRLLLAGSSLLVMLVVSSAEAEPPPLPPPRPAEPGKSTPSPAAGPSPPSTPVDVPTPTSEPACLIRLREAGFRVAVAEPPNPSNGMCRIEDPVRLSAVPVANRPAVVVALPSEPLLAVALPKPMGTGSASLWRRFWRRVRVRNSKPSRRVPDSSVAM